MEWHRVLNANTLGFLGAFFALITLKLTWK